MPGATACDAEAIAELALRALRRVEATAAHYGWLEQAETAVTQKGN